MLTTNLICILTPIITFLSSECCLPNILPHIGIVQHVPTLVMLVQALVCPPLCYIREFFRPTLKTTVCSLYSLICLDSNTKPSNNLCYPGILTIFFILAAGGCPHCWPWATFLLTSFRADSMDSWPTELKTLEYVLELHSSEGPWKEVRLKKITNIAE